MNRNDLATAAGREKRRDKTPEYPGASLWLKEAADEWMDTYTNKAALISGQANPERFASLRNPARDVGCDFRSTEETARDLPAHAAGRLEQLGSRRFIDSLAGSFESAEENVAGG